MIVYRITVKQYAHHIFASGNPARWNPKDVKMVYTAGSRALACLENVVHRTSLGLQALFCVMIINIPDSLVVEEVDEANLLPDWKLFENLPATQRIGDAWIRRNTSPVLKVPSAIIPREYNYLLNPNHRQFERIELVRVEPFEFDPRIKN